MSMRDGRPDGTAATTGFRDLKIEEVVHECANVLSVRLRSTDGGELPSWQPGAHIDVRLPSGLIRQYSLCGDQDDRCTYRIAVLLDPLGRGGSVELHALVEKAPTLCVRGPRNNFEMLPAPDYLFLAGGIGITPIASMVRRAEERGERWSLHYGGRTRDSMAFAGVMAQYGDDRVRFWPQDECGLMPIAEIIEAASPEAHIYACGPEPMLTAIARYCEDSPAPRTLRVERFGAAAAISGMTDVEDAPGSAGDGESSLEEPFEVELQQTGVRLTVPPDRSVLEVVREALPDVEFSCQEGHCGTCETQVIEGEPDHRDSYLTDEERESNEVMMICVSRSRGPLLRLLL